MDVLKQVASHVKQKGGTVRINTNGLANVHYGRDVTIELADLVDVMSVSLNADTAEKYDNLCHSIYGKEAFSYMLDFAKKSVSAGIHTVLSVVDVISQEEIQRCHALAKSTGATLRVRVKQN